MYLPTLPAELRQAMDHSPVAPRLTGIIRIPYYAPMVGLLGRKSVRFIPANDLHHSDEWIHVAIDMPRPALPPELDAILVSQEVSDFEEINLPTGGHSLRLGNNGRFRFSQDIRW